MCLFLFAVPDEPGRVGARHLAEATGLQVRKEQSPPDSLWFSRESGCACSMLTDDADFSDEFWAFDEEVLPALAKAVEILGRRAGRFTFQAIWAGDDPEAESDVGLRELIQAVRTNRIRNAHVYRVR